MDTVLNLMITEVDVMIFILVVKRLLQLIIPAVEHLQQHTTLVVALHQGHVLHQVLTPGLARGLVHQEVWLQEVLLHMFITKTETGSSQ